MKMLVGVYCEGARLILKKQICSNGAIQYKMGCADCDRRGNPIKHAELTDEQKGDAELIDTESGDRRRCLEEIEREREAALAWEDYHATPREDRDALRRAQYEAYIASPQWAEKRRLVFERAGAGGLKFPRCEARIVCEGSIATEVHHWSYTRWMDEDLEDLVAVCDRCHRAMSLNPKFQLPMSTAWKAKW